MKRELLWIATIAVAVLTAGCGGKSKAKAEEPAPPPPAAVENTVVAEEPAAPPPLAQQPPIAPGSTGVPACDEYLAVFDQMMVRCADKVGAAKEAMQQARDAQQAAFAQWSTMTPEERQATHEAATPACQSAVDAIRQSATAMSCPLD